LQEQVAREHNFRLTNHVLELYGICTRCQTE
jgi:Fe2+ or Zn2+ uptake regulation protein